MRFFYLCLFFFTGYVGMSQNILLKGEITDSMSDKPVEMVNIYLLHNARIGTISNKDGEFYLKIKKPDTVVFSHISYKSYLYYPHSGVNDEKIHLEINVRDLREIVVKSNRPDIRRIILNFHNRLKYNYVLWKPVFYRVFVRILETSDNHLSIFQEYFLHLYQKFPFLPKFKIIHGRTRAFTKQSIHNFKNEKLVYVAGIVDDLYLLYFDDFLKERKFDKFNHFLLNEVTIDGHHCYHIRMISKNNIEKADLYVDKLTYALVRIKTETIKDGIKDQGIVNFQKIDGKWYLKSSKNSYISSANPNEITERLCVYSLIDKEPLKGYKSVIKITNILLSRYSSDFDSNFWKNKQVVPLPDQIKKQLK